MSNKNPLFDRHMKALTVTGIIAAILATAFLYALNEHVQSQYLSVILDFISGLAIFGLACVFSLGAYITWKVAQ